MTEKAFRIFVVDDESLPRMIITDQLHSKRYQIHEFSSGEACLAAMDLQPNLILLDIEMPGKSGLDVCREIRANDYDDVQVMFVSAHDDLDTLLAAFDAGGNDFIPKNAKKDVLLRKVEVAVDVEEQKRQLKSQLSYAQKTAFTAMSSLGETGIVLQFLRSSFHCLNLQQLGNLLTETLHQFGIKGLLKLSDAQGEYDVGSEAVCTSLEKSILHYVAKLGRIHQSGGRLVLNYPHVTLLIMDLNLDDEDTIGRLRDHLAIIAEGIGVRIDAMNVEQQRLQQANERIEVVKELTRLLSEIEAFQHNNHNALENLTEQYRFDMEAAFVNLGLTDNQELLLQRLIDQLTAQLTTLFQNDSRLALRLRELVDKQKMLLNPL
jgi:CheY-like chemotaxis protein